MKWVACCQPRKRQLSTSKGDVDCRKFQPALFNRLMSAHKSFFKVLMPKVPRKVKILKKKLSNVLGYIFYGTIGHEKCRQRQPLHFSQSTLTTAFFNLVNRLQCRLPFDSLFHQACKKSFFLSS